MLIDTHSHLYLAAFDEDREAMLDRARKVGVEKVLLPAIDSSHHAEMLELSNSEPDFFRPMMGVHPCSIQPESWKQELETALKNLNNGSFCAVGEIGIDLYWDKSTLELQKEAFRIQIGWAKERNLPIVIHCRESFNEIFEVLDRENDESLRGVFHCFTGNETQAQRILEYGDFMLGLGGVLTFKNSGVDKAIANIHMKYFVLETDAPYLAPAPYRGKRNESAYVELVARKLAEVKGCSMEEVARVTTENAVKMFQL